VKQRIVVDNSTLVSAAIRSGSIPDRALRKALDECEVCASIDSLSELEEVLVRPKFNQYLGGEARRKFMNLAHENFRVFSMAHFAPSDLIPSCRDPRDDKFLALALVAKAGLIISSDDDLLALHPWRGIPIVRPAEFVAGVRNVTNPDEAK
jgi:putative PIN family toxin of toxin-antitoxin system